jgi:hypothetical protein
MSYTESFTAACESLYHIISDSAVTNTFRWDTLLKKRLICISKHGCVSSTSGSTINIQVYSHLFDREKSVCHVISSLYTVLLSFSPCIFDAYITIRSTCDYRDSTLTKNHLIYLITSLIHLPFHTHPYLSCLSLVPASWAQLGATCLHPFAQSHTKSSLAAGWMQGLASLFIILKSYFNVC